jgi:hypothetical protein
LRYYGVDLADVVTGRMSPRRLASLVAGLPADSATVRSTLGGDSLWGLPEHLLARILDTLAGANWQRSGGKGPRPKPVPRPGADRRQRYGRTTASAGDVMDYLRRFQPVPEEEVPGDG